MDISELDYHLPPERIAQRPADRRDGSRLLVVPPAPQPMRNARFGDVVRELTRGDLLVLNDTRVLPAKLRLRRATGGAVEGLFLEVADDGEWVALLKPSRKLHAGERLQTRDTNRTLLLVRYDGDGEWRVRVEPPADLHAALNAVGETPLPPYIARDHDQPADRDRYQTVYARREGAVAAPTAGLHFTTALLEQLQADGVGVATVTLHVGAGTFQPIAVEKLADHPMHTERFTLPPATADAVQRTRDAGNRVVAVGTTSLRVLESCATPSGALRPGDGRTDLFIYPPYAFRAVDLLITNFHLPRSTLLALVFAFGGTDRVRAAYETAIREGYRFYSYGDAMLLHRAGVE